ncbi:hypothetical protein HK098_007122, partial [Nowakowskiella sp. JEL0407]
MKVTISLLALASSALAMSLEARQSCPSIHIFGARETTAPAGYGTAGTVVNLIKGAYPSATSEAINYPACGGQSSCGGVAYSSSAQQGTNAVVQAVTSLVSRCPNVQIVLVGYSQGGEIMNDAVCGGTDSFGSINPISSSIVNNNIKAVILMGDPRHVNGSPFNVGTATANGFAARPAGFSCSPYTSKLQLYCDAPDPYCSNGSDANTHQQYGNKYGQQALTFVKSKLSSTGGGNSGGGSNTTTRPATSPATSPSSGGGNTGGNCSALW